jgi:hypothetical protein
MLGDKPFNLPTNPMDAGLDPMFDQASFDASWMCGNVDRRAPFDCSFEKPLAQGAAQLTAQTLGTLADMIESDTSCGFSSPSVLAVVQTSGNLGDPGGSATFTISQACKLSFPMKVAEKTDCNQKATYVQGTALVTGTKTIKGDVSGDPNQPIVPTTRDPAALQITATFTDFKVSTTGSNNALTIKSGQLSGTIEPRVAIDTTTGACSIPTPVAKLSNIAYQNALLEVQSMGKTFDVAVASANLTAINGSRDGTTNSLIGTINVDGMDYPIPVDGSQGLDPSYNQMTFDSSYACTPNMKIPANDGDCDMQAVLAGGSARLLIQALGGATSLANSDDNCGFSANLTSPSAVIGNDGQPGALEWTIQNCVLPHQGHGNQSSAPQSEGADCLQRTEYMSGSFNVSGMRHVDGIRQDISILFLTFHSITPNSPESVKVHLDTVTFNEFKDYALDSNQQHPDRAITIHSGTMTALVDPITGEEANTPGKFDIPTKVVRFQTVAVTNAALTILYMGKTFNVHVDSAMLNAFNGSYQATGEKNLINGTMSVGGRTFMFSNEALDPTFSQSDFDMRYACTNNLKSTIPPAP